MVKTYLTYLLKNPIKLAWIFAVYAIMGAFAYFFFKDLQEVLQDNGLWVIILICLFITGVFVAVTLQPFIEWRDGKNRN